MRRRFNKWVSTATATAVVVVVGRATTALVVPRASSAFSISASPTVLHHGEFSTGGYGIHGPPAVTLTVEFRPGGSSVLPPTATASGSSKVQPQDTPPSNEVEEGKKEPKALKVEKEGEVEEAVERLAKKTGSARRARQLTIAAAGRGRVDMLELGKPNPASGGGGGDDEREEELHRATPACSASRAKVTAAAAVVASNRTATLPLVINSPSYSLSTLRSDLDLIRRWAWDLTHLSTRALFDETVGAILSAASRYYPDLPTHAACRVILADILAESDFNPSLVSGARLGSGSAWGLMQVSPYGSGRELELFKNHAVVDGSTTTWERTGGGGVLLDWKTGNPIDLASLKEEDLLRPWVNIHVASWVQSNLARTRSLDPYSWEAIAKAAKEGWKVQSRNVSDAQRAEAWAKVERLLGESKKGVRPTFKTGLGSWVAGPASSGDTGYRGKGDDVSKPYLERITKGLGVLYGAEVQVEWIESLALTPGLIDYH